MYILKTSGAFNNHVDKRRGKGFIKGPHGHSNDPSLPNVDNRGHLVKPHPLLLSTWLLNAPFSLFGITSFQNKNE